ncbi:MAG: Molybdenum cofactor biosynthesis protein MoaD [Hydrogenibacillus schlegelii]|uniref:Molybdenum cofactor biosynthesis protein MoaD n=1 Tax=Hydrogenibacillus schlegelii TaxID=1484 RepID=A0A2T5GCY2_HYDSH|nr:ubiquitin-like small modifier protein 1 [Hydrogenibacillus schlegelii]PTQ54046.1 MAG: Molybdenum cofactor biosynthesis protein MoaD [Hydrogenibacillus schlegelii]
MKVRLFATLRDVSGVAEVDVAPAGERVRDVLLALVERHPALQAELFLPDGSLKPLVQVFVNGRNIHFTGGLETPVGEGDAIAVFPPVAGG